MAKRKGKYRRNTTSLYLIESRHAERILAEVRKKNKARPMKAIKSKINPN
jgi:hypothetical protein